MVEPKSKQIAEEGIKENETEENRMAIVLLALFLAFSYLILHYYWLMVHVPDTSYIAY